jgi:hypothetical protein
MPDHNEQPRCHVSGKRRLSKKEAATLRNSRMNHGTAWLRIYECPDCGGWHLTHGAKQGGKKRFR